jgi:hypothetical protein
VSRVDGWIYGLIDGGGREEGVEGWMDGWKEEGGWYERIDGWIGWIGGWMEFI